MASHPFPQKTREWMGHPDTSVYGRINKGYSFFWI